MTAPDLSRVLTNARKEKLGLSTLHVLLSLDPSSPMTALAASIGVTTACITGLVDRLTALGFVTRYHGSADRRLVLVEITEAGRKAVERVLQ